MAVVYLAVGSNLGDRKQHLDQALHSLRRHPLIFIQKVSAVYDTEPVGGPSQGNYLNAVWEIETQLEPEALLQVINRIETDEGRVRRLANEPRTLDLDILFYDDRIIRSPRLTVPHPKLQERWFVLKPLSDIAPQRMHPVLRKRVSELLQNLIQDSKA